MVIVIGLVEQRIEALEPHLGDLGPIRIGDAARNLIGKPQLKLDLMTAWRAPALYPLPYGARLADRADIGDKLGAQELTQFAGKLGEAHARGLVMTSLDVDHLRAHWSPPSTPSVSRSSPHLKPHYISQYR